VSIHQRFFVGFVFALAGGALVGVIVTAELARRFGGALLFEGSGVATVRLSPFH